MPNKEDDLYLVIGTEDGYFDKVDMKEYIKAKKRLEGGYYDKKIIIKLLRPLLMKKNYLIH